jgi:hypothetical protein
MSIKVELLTPGRESQYEALLLGVDSSPLYASLAFRRFLRAVLTESRDRYLIAIDAGEVVGALPSFVKYNAVCGNVLNSLPFFGSNGGITVAPEAANPVAVKSALMNAFISLAVDEKVVASTLISNPLQNEEEFYRAHANASLRTERVGQITPMPRLDSDDEHLIEEQLMASFHPKTRNSIRKGQNSKIMVRHSSAPSALNALAEIHRQNMADINRPAKPVSVFKAIRENFDYDQHYRVYLAEKDRTIIAALLVLYYHRTAEYYTPATLEDYRLFQPMSMLIFEAMKDAVCRGILYWNWGGPGPSQPNIYNYKKRWGTVDYPYYYYTKVFDGLILGRSKATLLQEYPYYYVAPFGELKDENT